MSEKIDIKQSIEDDSVNFIIPADRGYFEARFVQRTEDYFIIYLSAQSGCDQGCRMCHLTASGQTKYVNADLDVLREQTKAVLDYYKTLNRSAPKVHVNFMARGEPLNNTYIQQYGPFILEQLENLIHEYDHNLNVEFLISTIMPESLNTINHSLCTMFVGAKNPPRIFYSLYSMDPKVRKRWLGKAMDPNQALNFLRNYQLSYPTVNNKIHFAFIKNVNDDWQTIQAICDALKIHHITADVNIVRYNPYSVAHGEEPDDQTIEARAEQIRSQLNNNVVVIPRVGYDVKASCGMFIEN